jgi:hypothetical protein
VLPIYRKLNIHVLIENVLASWLLTFWSECVSNLHSFAHDDTSTAVQLISPYHPNQLLRECCYPLGRFVPAASHPNVAIDACAGRLLMMEHEVKSVFNNQRAFNSYSDSLVSHFSLPPTVIAMCFAGFKTYFDFSATHKIFDSAYICNLPKPAWHIAGVGLSCAQCG